MAKKNESIAPSPAIKGFSLSSSMSVRTLVSQMKGAGLQATQVGRAAEIIENMQKDKATIILTFTTNLITSGLRETIAELVKQKKVHCIITAIGSIEEDLMKTLVPSSLNIDNLL